MTGCAGEALGSSTLAALLEPAKPSLGALPVTVIPPLATGAPWSALLSHAARRESALLGRRLARRARVLRLPAGSLRPGPRDALRRLLSSGGAAAPAAARGCRRLDVLASQAGLADLEAPRLGSGGAVRAVARRGGLPVVLRVGRADAGDPWPAAAALRALPRRPGQPAPELLAVGHLEGLRWTVETRRPGRRPPALHPRLTDQVADWCATLPRFDGPVELAGPLNELAARFPEHEAALAAVATELLATVVGVPAILCHGDLWRGNLLAVRGGLSGVVDWDAARPDGLPGVDLLHLVATERRLTARQPLGAVWARRPWREPDFAAAAIRRWPELRHPAVLDAVGTSWWGVHIAADLRRRPALAKDPQWTEVNVHAVVAALQRG